MSSEASIFIFEQSYFKNHFKSNTTSGEIVWIKLLPKADFENNKRLIQAAAVQDIYSKKGDYNEGTGFCRIQDRVSLQPLVCGPSFDEKYLVEFTVVTV